MTEIVDPVRLVARRRIPAGAIHRFRPCSTRANCSPRRPPSRPISVRRGLAVRDGDPLDVAPDATPTTVYVTVSGLFANQMRSRGETLTLPKHDADRLLAAGRVSIEPIPIDAAAPSGGELLDDVRRVAREILDANQQLEGARR